MTVTEQTIPQDLIDRPQWVCWRLERRNGKDTKVPYSVAGGPASTTDASTWCNYETAVAAKGFSGVGFVFVKGGGLVGIDLDKCVENGKLKPWAKPLVSRFDTYAEVSPSGTGIKLFCRGKLPSETGKRAGWRDGAIEMYDHSRFFTVTGLVWNNSPSEVRDQQAQIDGLHKLVFKVPKPPLLVARPSTPALASSSDQVIIDKLLKEPNQKAAKLWSGDTTGYTSASEADAALACKIAFYTGADADRIDRLFRQSLLCRDKWTERADYRAATIGSALQKVGEFYDWSRGERVKLTVEQPPEQSHTLGRLLLDTIEGKRKNMHWVGFPCITNITKSLLPGTITVICGGAGSTKSMFLSQACIGWLASDVPFSVFHLEEDRDFHLYRALAQLERNSNVIDDEWVRDHPDETMEVYERHSPTLDRLGRQIFDAPSSVVTVQDVTDWVRDRSKDGHRIIAVDPITAADSGKEPWIADRNFILDGKKIMRDYKASLVVVTHPRDGNPKNGNHLDNMAGGKAYNRFTQSVFWLNAIDKKDERVVNQNMTPSRYVGTVNRVFTISKSRSGKGCGERIGCYFDGATLLMSELGVIREQADE